MLYDDLPVLKPRNQFQWKRKAFHLFNGILGFYLYVYSGLSEFQVLMFEAFCLALSVSVDIARMKSHRFNYFICSFFKEIIREGEKHQFTSVTKGLLGTLITLYIFPRGVDIIVILIVTFADPMGAYIGSKFGHIKINKHASLEGSLGVFVVSFLSGWFVCHIETVTFSSIYMMSLFLVVVGLIGMIAELSFPDWDDNWVIPTISCPSIYLLFRAFGHHFPLFKLTPGF